MWLNNLLLRWVLIMKLLSTVVPAADCCSSRIFQFKESTDTFTDDDYNNSNGRSNNIVTRRNLSQERVMSSSDKQFYRTMFMSKCSPLFELHYCLNGGRCFNYTIANYTSPSCECSEGYFGERCEVKTLSENYYRRPKISTANVCCGALAASILSSFVLYFCHIKCSNLFLRLNFDDG